MFSIAEDVFTFLVGGKAGEGVKKAGSVAARIFTGLGRDIFQLDEYESLIRGGHNFSVVSTAPREISSHYLHADLAVALDRRSYEKHAGHIRPGGLIVANSDAMGEGSWDGIRIPLTSKAKGIPNPELRMGVGAVAILAAALGLAKNEFLELVRAEYPRDIENNTLYGASIYDVAQPLLGSRFRLERGNSARPIVGGSEAVALGAYAAGLDIFFAYPMTPSSTLLHFLASKSGQLGVTVMHPESEVAVINMAVGATYAGARAMLGTSGGGFGLMAEGISFAGMAESPLLCFYAQRSGPSTGAATLHEQSDLRFVVSAGHGEFPRIVASPSDVREAYTLAAEMMALVWEFQTPGILLTEKHLAESTMSVSLDYDAAANAAPVMHTGDGYLRYRDTPDGISPLVFPPSRAMNKWTSHEHEESGVYSEKEETLVKMHDKRRRKGDALVNRLKTMKTVNVSGTGPVIVTYGSTTMMVREALIAGKLNAKIVQPVYLEPFPVWEMEKYNREKAVVVEQSSTGVFAIYLKEKAGISASSVILKYDGHPFDPDELAGKLRGVL